MLLVCSSMPLVTGPFRSSTWAMSSNFSSTTPTSRLAPNLNSHFMLLKIRRLGETSHPSFRANSILNEFSFKITTP